MQLHVAKLHCNKYFYHSVIANLLFLQSYAFALDYRFQIIRFKLFVKMLRYCLTIARDFVRVVILFNSLDGLRVFPGFKHLHTKFISV